MEAGGAHAVGDDASDDGGRSDTEVTPWSRRAFLAGTGTAAGVLAVGGATVAACGSGDSDDADDEDDAGSVVRGDWESVRDQFSLSADHRWFDAWVVAPHPRPVAEAIADFRDELDRTPARGRSEGAARELGVRRSLADFVGGDPEDIALAGGGAQALGHLVGGIRVSRDHEILTTHHDYLTDEAARLAASRARASLRRVRLFGEVPEASPERLVLRILGEIRSTTRVLVVPWVLPGSGLKLPISTLAEGLETVNAERDEADRVLLCVDASHALGIEEIDVRELGCDFLVAGLDHWMFGPRGTGFCWGREAAWTRVTPSTPTLAPLVTESWAAGEPGPSPRSAVLTTPAGATPEHRWAMRSAVTLQRRIGFDELVEHTLDQAEALKEGLAEIEGVRLITPVGGERSSALVCFRPEAQDPYGLVELLKRRYVLADIAPVDPGVVRLGPSIVTDQDDVDAALRAIRDLA